MNPFEPPKYVQEFPDRWSLANLIDHVATFPIPFPLPVCFMSFMALGSV